MIYADHAATTALSARAFAVMQPWLTEGYGNPSTLYSHARGPRRAIDSARETIASLIGATPDEIFFTSGGTESDNWAIKGSAFCDSEKRATITSAFEHHAVLHACESIERLGYPVAYIYPTRDGYITQEKLSDLITNRTRLVSVMAANNEIGSIQPIKELCEIAHANGALFHTDAVQAMGHIHIDVNELGVDMLSASAHKFNGPKGVGFFYIRKGTPIDPFMDGGSQEHSMRAGTENVAGIVGMAEALKENCEELTVNKVYLVELEQILLDRIKESDILFCRNGGANTLPGLISLSFSGADGEAILHRLDLMGGICVATGSACNSESTEISHVLQAIRLNEDLAKGTVRISFGKDNSVADAETIADSLIKILK